ncbi:arachidonate 5-lipoxygenase [Porites harrisoni]
MGIITSKKRKNNSQTVQNEQVIQTPASNQTVLNEHVIQTPAPSQTVQNEQVIQVPRSIETEHESIEWENMGFKIFKEIMGEELFKRKMEEADEPPSDSGPFSASQMKLFVKKYEIAYALRTLATQKQGTSPDVVGAIGAVTVLNNPLLPAHDFFPEGHVFPIRLRHSNFMATDDAQLDIRTVSLKFADCDSESPFDLMMQTGEEAAFWSIFSFDKMLSALKEGPKAFKEYCLEDPWHFYLAIAVFRRAPKSFTDQRYYSWMVFEYKAKDGKPRYAKFRLVPADNRVETGLMTEQEQRTPWDNWRSIGERRPENYLTAEFEERISGEGIQYKLQIQLHEIQPGDSHLILHAARAWDQDTHPWLDLADVKLTSLLPGDVVRDTHTSLTNAPPSISLPPAKTIYDYSSLAYLGTKVSIVSSELSVPKSPVKEDISIYCISVTTGNRKGAGTDANVTLTITGTNGRTKPLLMDKWFHNDFEAGTQDTYTLEGEDVGELLMIKLDNDKNGLFSDWFVEKVLITCSQNPQRLYEFPCHRWVQSESVFFEGKAMTVTHEQHEAVKNQRKLELQQRQEIFQWADDLTLYHLPGCMKAEISTLPKDVQFTQEGADDLHNARQKALANLGLIKLFNLFDSWDDFDDYRKAFVAFVGDVPSAAERWQDDRFYGSQFLNGCNPDTIKRCIELPSKFPVTQELVGNLLDESDTLQKAMEDGRVYMVDFEILEDIPHYGQKDESLERRYTCPAMGLFYVRGNRDIVPIAIQFHQVPSETNPIWTPNDTEMDWIYAKMWLRNADTQWHQMITHLLRCHLFMEPIAVACWRQLPSLHPLWKLLIPHIRGVIAINTLGRERLIPAGGVADNTLSVGGGGHIDLMKKYYKTMNWSSYDLPKVLKDRGVDDAEKLPNFHYRDDALKLWHSIKGYITKILSLYYHSDEDIQQDTELQAWILDLHDNGYSIREDESDHGVPKSITTADQLTHLLTMMIFTFSCQHAAVNFSQMDTFGFPPNSPALMRQPPPSEKGKLSMKDMMQSLATKHQAGVTIATVYDLTRIFPDERFLGDYTDGGFTDMAAREAILRFQGKLNRISRSIKLRNESLEVPYTYLLPERVPNGIGI